MSERLWGENYFNPAEKKWTKSGDSQFRAFNMFILDPIGKTLNPKPQTVAFFTSIPLGLTHKP